MLEAGASQKLIVFQSKSATGSSNALKNNWRTREKLKVKLRVHPAAALKTHTIL